MLSILCVRVTIKVKVGIPESFKVGWYPHKKLGRVTVSVGFMQRSPEAYDILTSPLFLINDRKFSGVKSERTVSKFRKNKIKFLRCAHLLRNSGCVELGSFTWQSCNGG